MNSTLWLSSLKQTEDGVSVQTPATQALQVNLDSSIYGSFAEIGAGQEASCGFRPEATPNSRPLVAFLAVQVDSTCTASYPLGSVRPTP